MTLGLPQSLSSIAPYGNKNKLTLPINSLTEEFIVARARKVLQYRESKDRKVSQACIKVRTGRKWWAQGAVDRAESQLHHRQLVGSVTTGCAGLGTIPTTHCKKLEGKARQEMVQREVRAGIEEQRVSQTVGLRQHGAMERKIIWPELWRAESYRIKFLIQSH